MNLENISDKLQNIFVFINKNKNNIMNYFNIGIENTENVNIKKIKIYHKNNKPKILIKFTNDEDKINYIIKTDLDKFIKFVESVGG